MSTPGIGNRVANSSTRIWERSQSIIPRGSELQGTSTDSYFLDVGIRLLEERFEVSQFALGWGTGGNLNGKGDSLVDELGNLNHVCFLHHPRVRTVLAQPKSTFNPRDVSAGEPGAGEG